MKLETHVCDICGIQKQDANHWWKVYRIDLGDGRNPGGLLIIPWDASGGVMPLPECVVDICGAQHLLEWISKTLGEVRDLRGAGSSA